MSESFSATIADWAQEVEGAAEVIFKESVQELVSVLNTLVPVDTGFLRASLRASTTEMPAMTLDNPGQGSFTPDAGSIELVIAGADLGTTIFLGYSARYGSYIHYGTNGRPGRPWVTMAAQRWQSIVEAKSAEVFSRLGLS